MKILLGLPMLGDVAPPVVASLMRVAAESRLLGQVVISHTEGLIPHDRGREETLQQAVANECDYILCLDTDMLFPSGTVARLLKELQDHKAQVASGIYLRRGYPYTSVWSKYENGKWNQVTASSGVHTIHMTGLGCALIDVKWLKENVSTPFCTYTRRYDRADVLDDESLFEKIRHQGGKIIGVGDVQCAHLLKPEFVTIENANKLRRDRLMEYHHGGK